MQVLNHPSLNHKMEVRSGVLAGRSAALLQEFFRSRSVRLNDLIRRTTKTDDFPCGEVREWLKRSASKADIP